MLYADSQTIAPTRRAWVFDPLWIIRSGGSLFVAIGLAACGHRDPDRVDLIEHPGAISTVEVQKYEAKGTLSGGLVVAFRGRNVPKDAQFTIHRIKAGRIGWIASNVLLVAADKMQLANFDMVNYVGYDSSEAKEGAHVLVIPCLRTHMDCSPLEARFLDVPLSVEISPYALDHQLKFWAASGERE